MLILVGCTWAILLGLGYVGYLGYLSYLGCWAWAILHSRKQETLTRFDSSATSMRRLLYCGQEIW